MADHHGGLAHATYALASLHSTRVRIAQGLETQHYNPEQSLPKQFYDRALLHLVNNKSLHGNYSEADALAAVQLINFSVIYGGWPEWNNPLDVACECLSQTGIHEEQNPKLILLNMTPAVRFAAKMTMVRPQLSSFLFSIIFARLFFDLP